MRGRKRGRYAPSPHSPPSPHSLMHISRSSQLVCQRRAGHTRVRLYSRRPRRRRWRLAYHSPLTRGGRGATWPVGGPCAPGSGTGSAGVISSHSAASVCSHEQSAALYAKIAKRAALITGPPRVPPSPGRLPRFAPPPLDPCQKLHLYHDIIPFCTQCFVRIITSIIYY